MIVLSDVVAPREGIRISQPQVVAFVESERCGEGELIIAEHSVTWICSRTQQGFSLTYPSIILHAISRDDSVFRDQCLYVMVDTAKSVERRRPRRPPELIFTDITEDFGNIVGLTGSAGDGKNAAEANVSSNSDLNLQTAASESSGNGCAASGTVEAGASEEQDDDEAVTEVAIRFVPSDESVLQELYQQMCECQSLNRDEDDDLSEEFDDGYEEYGGDGTEELMGQQMGQGDGQWYTMETEGEPELSAEGMATLQRIMANSQRHAAVNVQNGRRDSEDEREQMDE